MLNKLNVHILCPLHSPSQPRWHTASKVTWLSHATPLGFGAETRSGISALGLVGVEICQYAATESRKKPPRYGKIHQKMMQNVDFA